MAERQESRLKRNLTFWNLMGVAIGQIIGAGIMTMTGTAIGMTGTGVALAFMISPVLTLITDFPQGILSSCALRWAVLISMCPDFWTSGSDFCILCYLLYPAARCHCTRCPLLLIL